VILSPFGTQVQELVGRLTMILLDSVKLNRYKNDPEMTADLYHRIARSYVNAPALRLTWLDALFAKNREHKYLVEAAECLCHMAAFISEYLYLLQRRGHPG
jgi:hypothetical protein